MNVEATQDDVALAVDGDLIAAIGPTDEILKRYPHADVYDGRGKAILPGLINCHMHMAAVLSRGFNEDFGFPNSVRLAVQPASLLQGEESGLMVTIAALEAIRTGTTTIVENTGNILRNAPALASTGLRCVFAESVRDCENVPGPMSPDGLANRATPPRFSPKLRDEGMQRINELFTAWHGKNNGPHQRVPRRRARRDLVARAAEGGPRVRGEARPRLHDPPVAEPRRNRLHEEVPRPVAGGFLDKARLPRSAAVRGALPVRGRCRHRAAGPTQHHRVAPGGDGCEPRRDSADRHAARRGLPDRERHRQQHERSLRGDAGRAADRTDPRTDDACPGARPQPEDMLADATLGGARAVHQERTIGSLEVGKKADLLVVDTHAAHLVAGRVASCRRSIHNGQPSDIESVMVDGQFVMRDRKVLTMDEAALVAEADKVGQRVWDQVKKAGAIPIPRLPRPK